MNDIKNNANPELKIFLLGNKNDLIEERIVNIEEGKEIEKEFNIDLFKETKIYLLNNIKLYNIYKFFYLNKIIF